MSELELVDLLQRSLAGENPAPAPSSRRHARIGGTDCGAVLAYYEPALAPLLEKYSTAADVYERIVNGVQVPWNPRMQRGTAVEPLLRAKRIEVVGPVEPHPGILMPEDMPFAASSPDDFADGDTVVDYKSVSVFGRHQWGVPGSDQCPPHILTQLLWNMAVADRPSAEVFVGFGRDHRDEQGVDHFVLEDLAVYYIERDREFEGRLLAAARRFWTEHIERRARPAIEALKGKPRKK